MNLKLLDIILSTFIFIFTAINSYAFFYLLRETFRYISITYDHEILVLSNGEVKFYNLFFAAIAIILAMGSTSRFLVNRPYFQQGSIIERTKTLNDANVLNWVFMMWAIKLSFVLGIFFIASQSYHELNLYSSCQYIFYLFVVVLYLQQWTNYRRLFPRFTKKYFVLFTMGYLCFTYLIGSINFIDYERLNERVLSKNAYHKLRIIKPESTYWSNSFLDKYPTTRQLYLGFSKSNEPEIEPQLLYEDGKEIKPNSINSIVSEWKTKTSEHFHPRFCFQLNIDKSIRMKYVNELKDAIVKSSVTRIRYAVVPQNIRPEGQRSYKYHVIPVNLYDHDFIDDMFPDRLEGTEIFTVSHNNINLILKDVELSNSDFRKEINKIIESKSNYVFQMDYDENLEYGKFIEIYATILSIIMKKRDEYAMQKYNKKYDLNTREIKRKINAKFPIIIEDIDYQKPIDLK